MPKGFQSFAGFVGELKRRRVVGAVVAYTIAAAGVMQVADVVAPRLNLPANTVSIVILLALVGLPVVAALAWVYDVVPDARRAHDSARVPVPAAGGVSTAERASPAPATSAARPRAGLVAVLPFLNLSADPENEYFADGITEDVISHLSKVGALNVISRTSVMAFKKREQSLREIAAALGAATLLEGSVRRSGDRVRIVAQLVDAETDRHLWAETYDRELTDVFAIQTDVALQIAAALRAQLSPDERARIERQPTADLEAYQLYQQGRHWLLRYTAEGMQQGIRYFERAIQRDPGYALAYASIAMACAELAETGLLPPDDAYRRARVACATALALDACLAEAHVVNGQLKALCDFDWTGAEQDFQRALELSPSNADAWDLYGRMCAAQGRHDEAVVMEKRAQALDPLAHRTDLATALLRAGRYDEALEASRHAVEFDPHYDRARATLGWALLKTGREDEGFAELEQAVALSPGSTSWLAQLGEASALAGRTERAHEVLAQLEALSRERYVSPYHLAYVFTGLGEFDRAIDCLEQSHRERAGAVYGIKGSFLFAPLHPHPRFQALLGRMNLGSADTPPPLSVMPA